MLYIVNKWIGDTVSMLKVDVKRVTRRGLLGLAGGLMGAVPRVEIKDFTLWPVRATARTVWLVVQVRTLQGISGLGEASDAFGFAATTAAQGREMEAMLGRFVGLMVGRSPLDISFYRKLGEPLARSGGLVAATAYSAVEQALWDLTGQALGVPSSTLFGGALRERLPAYANINRATTERTPAGFAATAKRAVSEGFRAIKAAPWDGYPKVTAEEGIACTEAIRMAVGAGVDVMVDCHSLFSVAEAVRVARRLEGVNLRWYEEPVAPEKVEESVAIGKQIKQPMAGGEMLFGVDGFAPLCREHSVAVIMPDVKHCGGMLALTHIAAMAAGYGVAVAPHNPSGPVSTAATAQAAAGLGNCEILELQWGEVGWRGELVEPEERFVKGELILEDRAGLGISWNEKLARRNRL